MIPHQPPPKSILLFGGSFDPPHLGHRWVIENTLSLLPQIDELWLLPANHHTFDKKLTPAPHRLKMCQLLINDLSSIIPQQIKLCPLEIDYQTTGQTYQTLKLLQKEETYLKKQKLFPPKYNIQNTIYNFLIGSDQLPTFHKWGKYEQLLKDMTFFIYPRSGFPLNPLYPNMIPLKSPTQIITNLSSTLVRNRLSKNQDISSIVSSPIKTYIQNHKLYH